MENNVIFLDFDGVLHPNICETESEFCKLGFVAKTITPYLKNHGFGIVISSNWRIRYNIGALKKMLGDIAEYVVGVTPETGIYKRGLEIEEYVRNNGISKYIILEDKPQYLLKWQLPNTVVTDPRTGFTNKTRNKFIKKINIIIKREIDSI